MEKSDFQLTFLTPIISAGKKYTSSCVQHLYKVLDILQLNVHDSQREIQCCLLLSTFSTLLEPLECLLQLMLKWDPVQRGGVLNSDTIQPPCFAQLDQILNMKVSRSESNDHVRHTCVLCGIDSEYCQQMALFDQHTVYVFCRLFTS